MEHINNTKAYSLLISRQRGADSAVIVSLLNKLEELEKYLDERYPIIRSYYFEKYTEHGWIHTTRVLDYMIDIIDDPTTLTNIDLMLIIYVALLHDIGMAQTKEEGEILFRDDAIQKRVTNYQRNKIGISTEDARREVRTNLIRGKHGELAYSAVCALPDWPCDDSGFKPLASLFKLQDGNSQVDKIKVIADICKSHTESVHQMGKITGSNHSFIFVASILRIADYLDMVALRATEYYQKMHGVTGYNATHFNVNRIIEAEIIPQCETPCNIKCPNTAGEMCPRRKKQIQLKRNFPSNLTMAEKAEAMRMIDDYINDLECEITKVNDLLSDRNLESTYHIRLLPRIKTIGESSHSEEVEMTTQKLSVDYQSIKVLFSGNQLYKSKLHGLRELLQNAYDACKEFIENKATLQWKPKIIIDINSEADTFSISDNGIGMSEYVIREYFLNIGKSIYNCEPKYMYDDYFSGHIGHFGLGFFAAFMLSPHVSVETLQHKSEAQRIELDISTSYATLIDCDRLIEHGTTVSLSLSMFMNALCGEYKTDCYMDCKKFTGKITRYIENTFLDDGIGISIILDGKEQPQPQLQKIEIANSISIAEKLNGIEAVVKLVNRSMQFPPIFYAKDANTLEKVSYDDLLKLLRGTQREIPYLDGGNFLIFATDDTIVEDFRTAAMSEAHQYRSLSGKNRCISKSLNIFIDEFFASHQTELVGEIPTQCRYAKLIYVIDSRQHAALCEFDVPCSSHRIAMLTNDACGIAPLDDVFYMRSVLLSDLHIVLPYLNYRYSFEKLIANIETNGIYPTLSRDSLTDENRTELCSAIGKAISECKDSDEDQLISELLYGNQKNNVFYNSTL